MNTCSNCRKNLSHVASPIEENGKIYCCINCTPNRAEKLSKIQENQGIVDEAKEQIGLILLDMIRRQVRVTIPRICIVFTISVWIVIANIATMFKEGISTDIAIVTLLAIILIFLMVREIERFRRG